MLKQKYTKGFTLIELIVVIAIIAVLASLSLAFFTQSQRTMALRSASEIVQASLVKARELARSPKPSGDITSDFDINGYGIFFSVCDCTRTTVFQDALDLNHPEYMYKWVDPYAHSEDVDDALIHDFNLPDVNITQAGIHGYALDGVDQPDELIHNIVFKYNEITNKDEIYFDGDNSYSEIKIYMYDMKTKQEYSIVINNISSKIEVET
jgi:prepilin-type N-terminal cleavage/methylation domain-containing protein